MPVPYEEPGNLRHQTQVDGAPGDYARALADRLEEIFGRGIHDLDGIVAALNRDGPAPEGAESWTAETFEAEMTRLGPGD